MSALPDQLRSLRIIYAIMFAMLPVYACLGEFLGSKGPGVDATLEIGCAVCGMVIAAVAIFFRRKTSESAGQVLRSDPENQQALTRWRSGQIVSFVLAESIVLLGFAQRFLGGPVKVAILYYFVAGVLFLLFRPSEPVV